MPAPSPALRTGHLRLLLRLEGAGVFLAAVLAYSVWGRGWLFFGALLLAPDLSMLGYAWGNARHGARLYNAAHTYLASFFVLALGVYAARPVLLALGLVWAAHIGMDRALGYGLKYPSGFADTHLGRIGKRSVQR